jgi:hypothetical protein
MTDQKTATTMKLPVSSVEWLLIRDKIRVNAELKNEIMDEIEFRKIGRGTPVGLIAREIVHDSFFTLRLEGFPLFLVADVYNGNKGWIDTSGSAGAAGSSGALGKPGFATQNKSRPGDRGADGQPGARGASASAITLIAATIHNAMLSALGGPGGAGGNGGTGGRGADGKQPAQVGKFEAIAPTDGGAGGNGGNGGAGGSGAQITVSYVNLKGALSINSTGGAGGPKGQPGVGGKPGIVVGASGVAAKSGTAGKSGVAGAAGKSVTAVKTHQHLERWDLTVLAALGKTVDKWAAYRTRVGEYAFRRHSLSAPKDGDIELRKFARNEFLTARRLARKTARAEQLLEYLDSNLTPVGVPYDHNVMPDFLRFEEVLTDYGPWVQSLFSDAHLLLQETVNTATKEKQLATDLVYIDGMRVALELELKAKDNETKMGLMEIGHAQGRLKANQKEIEANREEQAKERLEAADDYFYGTVAQVGAVVVAAAAFVYTGGASLSLLTSIGLLPSADLLMNAENELSWSYDEKQKSWLKGDQSLLNMIDRSKEKAELKQEFKDLGGGLKEAVAGTKDFIDKFKTASDLLAAKVDGALQHAAKELLIRHLDLTFEINLLGLKQEQVLLERASIAQEWNATNNDYQLVGQFKDEVEENIQSLGRIAQALIRQAQSYADLLIKYTFYATRAFDLWTLQSQTSNFAFDCGHLHPDAVERAFQATARGDGSRVLELVGQYLPSWSKLPDLIKLRDKYEDYSSELVTETWFWSFTGRDLPASLKQHGSATFRTKMPKGRYEAKILNVAVALVGATADDPSVTVVVEHTGEATAHRRDGQTISLHQPPRRDPISASFDSDDLGDLDEVERQQFWGRSPEAVWRVSIDSQSAANSKLDLKGLKELQFAVYYKCFFVE